ncbi:MAG: DUF6443 domain-containing protein [Balneolaceae bacterium]
MKKRIWSLGIVIGLILVPITAFAQLGDEFAHTGVKTFPSPTAASIAKVQEMSIDQFNGANSVSLPLYEFSYYGLSVPVSLHYNSSGLRVQERASWVGLGWSLKAGGVITRVVRHLPDDSFEGFEEHENTILNFDPDETNPDSSDKATYDDIVDGDIDSEPDKFIISLPGYSGEMFFMDGHYELRSEKKIKIEPIRQGGGLPTANTIISWVLTDESGIKYTFAQKEYTTTSVSTIVNSSVSSGSLNSVISSWYLTKIEHPQHAEYIILEYDEGTSPGYGSVQKTFTQGRQIITDLDLRCVGEDNDIESQNVIDNDAVYLKKIKLSSNNNYYVEFWTQSRTDLSTERRLHYMDIREGSGALINIDFNYDYFTNPDGHKRLKLEDIDITSSVSGQNPLYTFEYNAGSIPNYDDVNDKYAVDHWGYYNGQTNNTSTIPDTYFGGVLIYNGANREPSSASAKIAMLKKITYQTGGYTEFTYEGNTYSKVANTSLTTVENSGGVRVASITYSDGISSQNNIVKNYTYGLDDGSGLSSGKIAQEPYYLKPGDMVIWDSGTSTNVNCDYQEVLPSGFYTIGEYTGNRMGYTKVTESYSSAASNGKIVSYFKINPNVWRGDKTKSETLNSSGSKLKEDSYGHYFSSSTSESNRGFEVERFIYSYKTSPLVTVYDTTWVPKPYTIDQYKTYISSDTTRIFNGAADSVVSSRSYVYNSNLLISSITETGDVVGSKVTTYGYANDKYTAMRTKHMYSQIYSVKEAGRKQWTIWDNNVTGKVGYWMPESASIWNGTGSIPPADPDANSIEVLDILKYDSYGNVLEVNDANGNLTKYYFGDNSNPLTQNGINSISGVYLTGLERIQASGSGVDLTQTAKYDTHGRVTEMKDESGVILKYTWDALDRLTEIRDSGNTLLEDYTYSNSYSGTSYAHANSNHVRTRSYDNGNTVTSYQFFDGLGRPIQTQQSIGGSDVIVQHVFYDELGRQEAVTKPVILSSGLSYKSISSLVGSTWDPGEALATGGSVYGYYKNTLGHTDLDSKYAYAQTAYEASPLGRATKQASPGYTYRMNSTRTIDSEYGLNASTNEDFDGTNELGFPINTLLRQQITNENEVESWQFVDAWGRTVMEVIDLNGDDGVSTSATYDIFTGYEYDGFGNLTKVHEPEGWGTANLKREYTYDKLNRITSENTPYLDASTEYKYDKAGNLRFVRNAEHKESGSEQTTTKYLSYQNTTSSSFTYPKNGILNFDVSFSSLGSDYVNMTLEKMDNPEREIYREAFDGWDSSGSNSETLQEGSYRYNVKVPGGTSALWSLTITERVRPFQFSYTKYDELDRVTEAGEYWGSSSHYTQANAENESWPTSSKQAFTLNYYDVTNGDATATNLTGRLARSRYLDPVTWTWGDTWYSYDSKGRVSWVKQKLPGVSTKRIDYEYTTQGLVTEIIYQDGSSTEEMHFWYTYDSANRLTHVYSNREDDFANAKLESNFSYTAEGQIDQQALGGDISSGGAQLLDYEYHIRGWLAKINDPDNTGSPTGFADDRFGMELRYESQSASSASTWEAKYNGDISQIRWKVSAPSALTNDNPLYNYKYDNASRLINADFNNSNTSYSAFGAYDVSIGHLQPDVHNKVGKSGNLVTMRRYNDYVTGGSETFTYKYYDNTNKLKNVIGSSSVEDYKYDAVGNMIFNDDRNVTSIAYNTQNLSYRLIQKYNSTTAYLHEYSYDNAGQRVQKRFRTAESYSTVNAYQNFIRGVDGEVLAVYSGSTLLYWNIPGGIGRITKF